MGESPSGTLITTHHEREEDRRVWIQLFPSGPPLWYELVGAREETRICQTRVNTCLETPFRDLAATSQKGHCLALVTVVTKEVRLSLGYSDQQTSQDVSNGPEHLGRRDIDAMKDVNERSQ